MNHRMIRYILFWIIKIEAFLMLAPLVTALIYREYQAVFAYFIVSAVCLAAGILGTIRKPDDNELYMKDGFIVVALCWIVISLIGAVPFVALGEIPNYIDALFQIVSGFTTTGSSAIADIEVLSHAGHMWLSVSHWIGGMGVLVFLLMLMPVHGGRIMNLMKAESPGPDVSKFVPRVRNTAIVLYRIYIVLTAAQVVVLKITGMDWFESICISLSTAGTGGFGLLGTSCETYTAAQQWTITVFMLLFGVSFTFYYLFLRKKAGAALKMTEVRVYLIVFAAASVLIALNISSMYANAGDAFRTSAFQVASIMTTTGFSTADFAVWPAFSRTLLLLLMCMGACAGSTGGGIKVSRIIILFKSVKKEIASIIHPKSVKHLKMDGKTIDEEQIRTVKSFLVAYIAIAAASLLIVSLDNLSIETNISAVIATMNNIGPGLADVGPYASFAVYGPLSKIVFIFDMLAGRLEIFPMLLLLAPSSWRRR